jgi:hypothetical protein
MPRSRYKIVFCFSILHSNVIKVTPEFVLCKAGRIGQRIRSAYFSVAVRALLAAFLPLLV